MLLAAGADPNAVSGEFGTALNAAAGRGCLNIVKLLLAAGADPSISAGKYGGPIDSALAGDSALSGDPNYHVANYLRRYLAPK